MLQQVLQNLGLSEKEAKVYLALLELGPSSAYEISKKTGIHHSTVYIEAENLKKKGLISNYEQSKKIKFVAEPPTALRTTISEAKEELSEKEQQLNNSLAELNLLFQSSQNKALVRFYEGEDGIKAVENDADAVDRHIHPNEVYSFNPWDIWENLNYSYSSVDRRFKRGNKIKVIYTHKDGIQNLTNPKIFREARFLPREKFPFNSLISIVPNHSVRMFSFTKGFIGIWIDNPEIANTLKMIWDVFWEIAEEEK